MPEVIPVEPRMPEVIPMEPQMPEVIPVEPQMPEVIPEAPQMPEVIPVEPQMPEVIPVEPQMPEVIPVEPQIPEAPQMPEVIPVLDQHPRNENLSEFSCPEHVSGAAMDTSEEPSVLHDDVELLRPDAVHVAAGRYKPKSPDVVTSSTAAPDVVMTKNDPMPRPPDVLAADSAPGQTPVEAFSGRGHSVEAFSGRGHSVEAFSGQGHCLSPTGPSVPQAPQQSGDLCPSQYMDVDSTQDLAIAELTRRGAVVFDAGDETANLLIYCDVVVQARFRPTDEVQDVAVFVSSLLKDESLEFDLLNMFPRVPLSRVQTLHAAGLVPRARLLFTPHGRAKLLPAADLLKASVLSQLASYQRAQDALMAASSRNDSASCSSTSAPISAPSSSDAPISSSNSGAVPKRPKWFKLGKQ
ncbi:uncharacterized protein LOC108681328 [Hyalella azteca]|uniref:Uncharacterized protein LOC108681328 n=1 Tax=Hyalella azteca TaxID=294128 RepID=A0A8B7PK62_HYAAZ|nr:uncharacterized protein LOC108681328 [Hyalella azteca]